WSRCAAGEGGRWADGAGNLTAGAGRLADGAGNLTAGAGPMNRPQCALLPRRANGIIKADRWREERRSGLTHPPPRARLADVGRFHLEGS
ncbi:MAG: hypothetical protein FJ109_18130, partial [Deltaproteobacteria bacterium]|nr:hypothetical protein [Deltaproteobacteria bacterium]